MVRSAEPLLSPAWSPDGGRLAYVSYEGHNSSVYLQTIATGAREQIDMGRPANCEVFRRDAPAGTWKELLDELRREASLTRRPAAR